MLTDTLTDQTSTNRRRAFRLLAVAALAVALPLLVVVVVVVVVLAGSPLVALVLGVVVAAAAAAAVTAPAWREAERRVLGLIDARRADPVGHARLFNLVEGLCPAAGLPRPQLFVVDTPAANAWALGRDPHHGCLVVTEGLLTKLDRIELEGVLAHELSHLRSADTLPTTLALSLCAGAGAGFLAPLATRLVGAAVGPSREAVADLEAVSLTRYPPGLLAALECLRDDPDRGALRAPVATAGLWTVPLDLGAQAPGLALGRASGVAATGLPERIQALREL
jgi:heat shock protein HtpX